MPKGSAISCVARLRAGQFYATIEGGDFVRLREVLDRARREPA